MKIFRTATLLVLSGFWMGSVGALSLGNISLLSKPGERLLAELEVKDISPVESNDLQAFLAAPDLYSVARVVPSPELALIKTQFKRKPNGTAVIEFSSEQPLTSPSLDMLIEFRWATGRRVFMGNVPTQSGGGAATAAAAPPPAPTLPVISPPAVAQPEPAPEIATAPTAPIPSAPAPAPAQVAAEKAPELPIPATRAAKADRAQSLNVVRGDTAGELAARHKESHVSLDQMLLALLRANPDAFVDNNVNRLKAGAVLKLPSAQDAQQTTSAEARQTIKAQAVDFAQYRSKLAANAPSADLPKAGRSAEGLVQSQVKDGNAAPSQDKLTLSKADSDAASEADKVAAQKTAEQTAQDTQNASKVVTDLNALAQAASGMGAPGVDVKAPIKADSGSVIDELIAYPLTPYAAGALVLLLAILGWSRSRRRNEDLGGYAKEPTSSPSQQPPQSPFNFDLELEAKPSNAPVPARDLEDLTAAGATDLNDAPPPSDYEVRLNLAEELWDMGQQNTARALADEVVREATGEIQIKAQRWLSQRKA
jgi:pilus assembly protein FimV